MADAMVTARMSQAKKEAGGRVLEAIGSSASQLINEAYDYLIIHGDSPFTAGTTPSEGLTPERIAAALSEIEELRLAPDNRFRTMSDEELRRERLANRDLMRS